jgi:3-dehydroquinate synthase
MKNIKFIVKTKSKTYPIYFGSNILNKTGNLIKDNLTGVKKICVIADNKIPRELLKILVASLKKFEIKIYKLTANEKTKSLRVANKIIENLLKQNFNRSDCVIALGGGVIGDLSAFVSSLAKRGLKFINIPTTLLAQVDASIGGKTAVNSNSGKNLIGTFYQPDFIISDISILKSLPQREIISGYGEILKHSLISNKKFFDWLFKNAKEIIINKNKKFLKRAIIESCKIKCKIVNKDETEKNLRMILNFGHTFAHGFEGAKNFSKNLNHGEAVLLGMMIASDLSYKKNLLPLNELILIKNHYNLLKLPNNICKVFKKNQINKVIYFMKKDKKNTDEKINLILLNKIGKTTKPLSFNSNSKEVKKFLLSYY